MKKADLVILGGGIRGLYIATVASQLNLTSLFIEKASYLKHSLEHNTHQYISFATHFLFLADTAIRLGLIKPLTTFNLQHLKSQISTVIEYLQHSRDPLEFQNQKLEIYFGTGKFINSTTFQISDKLIQAKRFILSSHSRPIIPPLPCLETIPYYTRESICEVPYLPEHLIILGSTAIGLEIAQAYRRLGSQVTILNYHDSLLPEIDPNISKELQTIFMYEGIQFHMGIMVKGCKKIGHHIILDCVSKLQGEIEIIGNTLVITTGEMPNIGSLQLNRAGVNYNNSQHKIASNSYCQTSNKRIYAIGHSRDDSVLDGLEYQASLILINLLLPASKQFSKENMPVILNTDPGLIHIGLTQEHAKQQGLEPQLICYSLASKGEVNLLLHQEIIVGATLLGEPNNSFITELLFAIQTKITLSQLATKSTIYPTLSTIMKELNPYLYPPKPFNTFSQRLSTF